MVATASALLNVTRSVPWQLHTTRISTRISNVYSKAAFNHQRIQLGKNFLALLQLFPHNSNDGKVFRLSKFADR